jgi:hypothetical protein
VGLHIQIQINEEESIMAGRPTLDVLTAMVTFVRSRNEIELRAGGMQRLDDGGTEHVEWLLRELAIGDEIRLRICDSEVSSEPISVDRETGGHSNSMSASSEPPV